MAVKSGAKPRRPAAGVRGHRHCRGPGQSPVIGKLGGEGWVQELWGAGTQGRQDGCHCLSPGKPCAAPHVSTGGFQECASDPTSMSTPRGTRVPTEPGPIFNSHPQGGRKLRQWWGLDFGMGVLIKDLLLTLHLAHKMTTEERKGSVTALS